MANFIQHFRSSIKRKMTSMIILCFSFIIIGAVVVPLGTVIIVQKYNHTTQKLSISQENITDIVNYTNEIILRVRGYFAYLDSYEYEQIFKAKDGLDQSLVAIKKTPLTIEEQNLVQRVELFIDNYLTAILPKGAAFVENGDYDSLRSIITMGFDNPVNDIIHYSQLSEKVVRDQLDKENDLLLQKLFLQGLFFILFILIVLFISNMITRRLARDIGNPLSELSQYAISYSKGIDLPATLLERKDEIGLLSRSLNTMIYEIQASEEELLAQNEELQAQQDELQAQQEELQIVLSRMEENEVYLNKRNHLTQSISNTLDKDELLTSIIHNLVEITQSDKGILLLMNENQDYAGYGITDEGAAQFIAGFGQSAANRSLYSRQSYQRERDATTGEKGYIAEPIQAYDLFVPLYKGNGDIIACIVLTRVGKEFRDRQVEEITSLSNQVSLSIEKLELFEATEGQRKLTQDMLNTIQEGVQLLDLEGKSLQVNQKLYELMDLDYEESELSGITLQGLKTKLESRVKESEGLFQFIQDALRGNEEDSDMMNYVLNKAEPRYIQIYWEPIYHNGIKFGVLLVHRDITKEHEVDRMKSEFVSTVSHELRTPLASILGFSELLLHRELKPEKQQKYMVTIHQEAKRLTQLVNDFLDLQRMENNIQFYDLKPLDLIPLLEEVKEIQQSSTSIHRLIGPKKNERLKVLGDRDKLYQVLVNLINNAIKYSPEGGEIRIAAHEQGDRIIIEISDEGLGIPEHALPSLFTKFYRVDNTDRREIGGTGLGLAIVKEIVNQHLGEVHVRSELGAGSTFSIILPIYRGSSPEESAKLAYTSLEKDATVFDVMLVENDNSFSIMLQDELLEKGYRAFVFKDGKSALQAIENRPPDVVVLDLKLNPDMSGWEIVERMRTSKVLESIPIIISSAFEEKDKALKWGITHFLIKPYEPTKLIMAIEEIQREKSMKDEENPIDQ